MSDREIKRDGQSQEEPKLEIFAEKDLSFLVQEKPDFLKDDIEKINDWVDKLPEGINKDALMERIKMFREKQTKNS